MGDKRACAPHHQTSVKFCDLRSCIFVIFQQITFKLGNFDNLKALLSVLSTDFPEPVHVKSWEKKTVKRSIHSPHTLSPPYKSNIETVHTFFLKEIVEILQLVSSRYLNVSCSLCAMYSKQVSEHYALTRTFHLSSFLIQNTTVVTGRRLIR